MVTPLTEDAASLGRCHFMDEDRPMLRRILEISLSLGVVLVMFGTSSIAEDDVVFDLSANPVSQASAQDSAVVAGDCPECPPVPDGVGDGLDGWRPAVPHFDLPSRSFSLFRSPASYGWGYNERCAPTPWKPRGNGIPQRTSCYRMDYRPYELKHDYSEHGPAFYMRYELYPCVECHEHAYHLQRFYGPNR